MNNAIIVPEVLLESETKALAFEFWWENEGRFSLAGSKDLCGIAWSNGAYKAEETISHLKAEIKALKRTFKERVNCVLNENEALKEAINAAH